MSLNLVPKYAFFVSGTGSHTDRLQAFEKALLNAGPIAHNLVTVSSILPAGCEIISAEQGFPMLTLGQITFCVMARQDTNVQGESASAAVGMVQVKDSTSIGYISEYHGSAEGKSESEEIAKRLAVEMFEAKTGTIVDIATDKVYAAAASVKNEKEGEWSSAVAICFLVL